LISFFFRKRELRPKPKHQNNLVRHSALKAAKFSVMKWMLDRIRHLIAAYLQKPASGHEPITPTDPYQTDLAPSSEPRRSSNHVGTDLDARRKELGVEDGLKELPGVTPRMLVAFAEHGINSVEDLADCATDDLHGWTESKDGKTIRHAGILSRLRVSRKVCEAIIMNARTKAGWFK
jgi:predicted flap endonuclease-1-like 5' DNA nuclease